MHEDGPLVTRWNIYIHKKYAYNSEHMKISMHTLSQTTTEKKVLILIYQDSPLACALCKSRDGQGFLGGGEAPAAGTHPVIQCEDPLDVLLGELGRALRARVHMRRRRHGMSTLDMYYCHPDFYAYCEFIYKKI